MNLHDLCLFARVVDEHRHRRHTCTRLNEGEKAAARRLMAAGLLQDFLHDHYGYLGVTPTKWGLEVASNYLVPMLASFQEPQKV